MKRVTGIKLQRSLQRMKMIDKENPEISIVIHNISLIEGFFKDIQHIGALHTLICARNILEQCQGDNEND